MASSVCSKTDGRSARSWMKFPLPGAQMHRRLFEQDLGRLRGKGQPRCRELQDQEGEGLEQGLKLQTCRQCWLHGSHTRPRAQKGPLIFTLRWAPKLCGWSCMLGLGCKGEQRTHRGLVNFEVKPRVQEENGQWKSVLWVGENTEFGCGAIVLGLFELMVMPWLLSNPLPPPPTPAEACVDTHAMGRGLYQTRHAHHCVPLWPSFFSHCCGCPFCVALSWPVSAWPLAHPGHS